jgi:hypothetical protein
LWPSKLDLVVGELENVSRDRLRSYTVSRVRKYTSTYSMPGGSAVGSGSFDVGFVIFFSTGVGVDSYTADLFANRPQ